MVEALEKVPELLEGSEKAMTAVYCSITGQVSGNILLVFSSPESLRLVDILAGQEVGQAESLDEMGISALKELGNVVIGSYVRVLSEGLKMTMSYSVP